MIYAGKKIHAEAIDKLLPAYRSFLPRRGWGFLSTGRRPVLAQRLIVNVDTQRLVFRRQVRYPKGSVDRPLEGGKMALAAEQWEEAMEFVNRLWATDLEIPDSRRSNPNQMIRLFLVDDDRFKQFQSGHTKDEIYVFHDKLWSWALGKGV